MPALTLYNGSYTLWQNHTKLVVFEEHKKYFAVIKHAKLAQFLP
jgi:hypothetical protein